MVRILLWELCHEDHWSEYCKLLWCHDRISKSYSSLCKNLKYSNNSEFIVVYLFQVYLVSKSIDPEFRQKSVQRYFRKHSYQATITAYDPSINNFTNSKCYSKGMDQGIHNWLLYSGMIRNFIDSFGDQFNFRRLEIFYWIRPHYHAPGRGTCQHNR